MIVREGRGSSAREIREIMRCRDPIARPAPFMREEHFDSGICRSALADLTVLNNVQRFSVNTFLRLFWNPGPPSRLCRPRELNVTRTIPILRLTLPDLQPTTPDVQPTIPNFHPTIPNSHPTIPNSHPTTPNVHPEIATIRLKRPLPARQCPFLARKSPLGDWKCPTFDRKCPFLARKLRQFNKK